VIIHLTKFGGRRRIKHSKCGGTPPYLRVKSAIIGTLYGRAPLAVEAYRGIAASPMPASILHIGLAHRRLGNVAPISFKVIPDLPSSRSLVTRALELRPLYQAMHVYHVVKSPSHMGCPISIMIGLSQVGDAGPTAPSPRPIPGYRVRKPGRRAHCVLKCCTREMAWKASSRHSVWMVLTTSLSEY
jgi:hypothetical protein